MDKYATERELQYHDLISRPRRPVAAVGEKVTDLRQSVRRDLFFILWETNQWNYTRRYTHTLCTLLFIDRHDEMMMGQRLTFWFEIEMIDQHI
jgi:hypothetical protein